MKDREIKSKSALEHIPKAEIQKGMNYHKKSASNSEFVAKSHLKAAKYTFKANWHSSVVTKEAQKEYVKHQIARF